MNQDKEHKRKNKQGNHPTTQDGENMPEGGEHRASEREQRERDNRQADPTRTVPDEEEVRNSSV
jgi:hypothetical protein